ncbi:MAG: phosphatase PAP2 family protein [Deltaproteobacteria bacterium]|nr:phosphatase PAP2 family protein [Deltaproteobacteria bacterium]
MLASLIVGLCATVGADAGTPYEVNPAIDLSLTLGLLAVPAIEEAAVKPALAGGRSCPLVSGDTYCDKAELNAIDRTVVGNDSKTWRRVSDIGQTTALALPVVATLADVWLGESPTAVADAATDVLVMAEAVATANFVTHVVKMGVRRPRPVQYVAGRSAGGVENQMSFPSGHTTAAAAGTTAYATTYWLRRPESASRFAVLAAGVSLTALTGYGRVGGGKHFYSDVVAGAIVGAVAGFVIPSLHRRAPDVTVSAVTLEGGAALRLLAVF